MDEQWHLLWLNPEPWAVGDIAYNRIAPDPNLVAYQAAVKGELEGVAEKLVGDLDVTFFFWRQQARYIDAADRIRQRNQADATNMQKALEDALQGVLFDNDRNVRHISSTIIEQGPRVEPRILIRLRPFNVFNMRVWFAGEVDDFPVIAQAIDGERPVKPVKNSWPPRRE